MFLFWCPIAQQVNRRQNETMHTYHVCVCAQNDTVNIQDGQNYNVHIVHVWTKLVFVRITQYKYKVPVWTAQRGQGSKPRSAPSRWIFTQRGKRSEPHGAPTGWLFTQKGKWSELYRTSTGWLFAHSGRWSEPHRAPTGWLFTQSGQWSEPHSASTGWLFTQSGQYRRNQCPLFTMRICSVSLTSEQTR